MVGVQTKDERDDEQLLRMCDQGAYFHRKDHSIVPRFKIMPGEIERVKKYMAENHSGVPYQLEYPQPVSR